ncbi:hypothetical protein KVV02_007507 [Mortierella alpina]|uniref:Uncharacterized protein n=1 Tax=Mortierella alpina TaxID=64518 RepID=A0A9P8D0D4_MORAP|nr:hypothetical protein KVV02_007507 [Mortierella alpina]
MTRRQRRQMAALYRAEKSLLLEASTPEASASTQPDTQLPKSKKNKLVTFTPEASSYTQPDTHADTDAQLPKIKKKERLVSEELAAAERLQHMLNTVIVPVRQNMPAAAVPGQNAPTAWTAPLLPDAVPSVSLDIPQWMRVFLMGGYPFLLYNKVSNKVMGECILRAIIHVLTSHGNIFMTREVFMHQYRTCFGCPAFNGRHLSYDDGLLDAKMVRKFVDLATIRNRNWYRFNPAYIQKYTTLPADTSAFVSEENLDAMPPSSPLDPTVVKQMVRDAESSLINLALRYPAFCPSDFDAGLPFQDMRRFLPIFYMELHPQPALPDRLPATLERMDLDTFNSLLVSAILDSKHIPQTEYIPKTARTAKTARRRLERNSQAVLDVLEADRQIELEAYWGPVEPLVPKTAPRLIPPPPPSPPPQDSAPPPPPPPSSLDHPMMPRPMSPVAISDDEVDAMDLEEPSPLTAGNDTFRHDVQSVSSGSEPTSPVSRAMPTPGDVVSQKVSRSAPRVSARRLRQERFVPYQAATSRNLTVRNRAPALEPRMDDALSGPLPVPLLPSLEMLSLEPLRQRRAVILSGPRLPRTEGGNPVPALAPGLPQSRTEILKRRREALDKILEYAWRLPMKIAGPAERLS